MKEMLQKLLELKNLERTLKAERVALEEQIFDQLKPALVKTSNTLRIDEYKITVVMKNKLKVTGEIPDDVDVYTQKVDDKKLKNFAGQPWVSEVRNKPTIEVIKEV